MDIKSELKRLLKGRVTIVGVGNTMRGDDGFGSILSEHLKEDISACVVNAHYTPENHVKVIRDSKAESILIIDAADFGGGAGDLKIVQKKDIPLYGLSTHNASLALFIEFLEAETKAKVYLLAVQPDKNNLGESLSRALDARIRELKSVFVELLPRNSTIDYRR